MIFHVENDPFSDREYQGVLSLLIRPLALVSERYESRDFVLNKVAKVFDSFEVAKFYICSRFAFHTPISFFQLRKMTSASPIPLKIVIVGKSPILLNLDQEQNEARDHKAYSAWGTRGGIQKQCESTQGVYIRLTPSQRVARSSCSIIRLINSNQPPSPIYATEG